MTTKYFVIPCHCNESTISFCLKISRTQIQLKQTHARLLKTLIHSNHQLHHLLTRLLRLPSKSLSYARNLFDQIPQSEKNECIWTSLIREHILCDEFRWAVLIYGRMHRLGVLASGFTFSSVLNACARIPAVREGKMIHARVVESGFMGSKVIGTTLVDMYGKCGLIEDARIVFDEMVDRDVVAWTAMVSGYTKMGLMREARALFDVMQERNVVSWTSMVAGYANVGAINEAKALYDQMPVRNTITWIAMIAGYGKVGNVLGAEKVFDEIVVKDESSWGAMIACYSHNGYLQESIEMYKRMRELNVKANEVAMVGVISACTQLGDVEMAHSLAEHVEEGSCDRTLILSNALIHMYAKCSSIDQALLEFNKMCERDVITYGALITALADHGRPQEALELFSKMQKEGVKPNKVTFLGVLNACSYAGLVEQGYKYFKLMTTTFKIEPSTEHIACMVDLLGRAGQLNEAYKLISENTGTKRDAGSWGALLGACAVHGNVQLGEISAQHLFEIEPENSGNYVLLANIYASVHRWDDAARVRTRLSETRMSKTVGYSWISNEEQYGARTL
ncbi:hypothetical protein MKW98_006104 [Papaver atlanticum]|uniref:Pentatricopeptide repeat-containing protein n=1 Tax=Papaver atlanticum TaxID=357466 RepID=A0AAD4TDY9_9MAGN|nr:hypothetical protein MKW98_006104 [Papaver atlanticum]